MRSISPCSAVRSGEADTPAQIVCGSNQDGRLEIFWIGSDSTVHHKWQLTPNGDWSENETLHGKATQIAVGNNADGY